MKVWSLAAKISKKILKIAFVLVNVEKNELTKAPVFVKIEAYNERNFV